ncbi:hypothetical protein [Hyphomicrobium sp. CS1GBMeth3]|uniref:hypothetical protein n=1 Tax=Hyphomicrobium sp. CS1GBMeth3 TaxID=1892845 RepID=UPI00093090ED|nr:hypothetical protein [Hyphomicrobium sp. CS1GBMeth3]
MILTIAIMVTLTIAIAAFALAPRMGEERIIFEQHPDRPSAFGYRMAWLAVRTRDTEAVLDELELPTAEPCNWRSGIGTVYDNHLGADHIFVSPPVNGWTFVVGLALPYPVGRTFTDKAMPLINRLGRRFGEVQYFFAYPPIDVFAWARLIEGRIVRAFAITDVGVVWNKGRTTKEERALGLKLFDFRGVRGRKGDAGGEMILYPTEEHVLKLAGRWSLDPTKLERADVPSPGLGYIALAPAAWRPERLRKAG